MMKIRFLVKKKKRVKILQNKRKAQLEIIERKIAKIRPDIVAIETKLNNKPIIGSNELENSDYKKEMFDLADNDNLRDKRKNEIIAEIEQIKNDKLELARAIITDSQSLSEKYEATREELQKAINNLKNLANSSNNSAERIVWEGNEIENQKLLSDLEAKLSKITPPEPEKEGSEAPSQQPTPPPSPIIDEEKKYGEDYASLKPTQQKCRKTICENWKKDSNYDRSQVCRYCSLEFHYDKSLEFLSAQEKISNELENHESNCVHKDNEAEQLEIKKDNWEKCKKSTERYFYSCRGCWGKVELDKNSDNDWNQTKKQGVADLAYHEEHECGSEENKEIAIYFSPNQGGNGHAPLSYADKIDENKLRLEKDNQGQVQQKQEDSVPNKEGNNYNQWLAGLGIVSVGILVISLLVISFQKNKGINEKKQ